MTSTCRGSEPTRRTCWPPRRASSGSRWWSRRTAKTVLVTGIDGFAGSHLSDLLIRRRHTVHGTIRRAEPDARAELAPTVTTHQVDLLERTRVDELMRAIKPQWVFHLAALSSPAASWQDPAGTIATNAGLEANLLAAAVQLDPMPRVIVVGSSDEYGRPPGRARRLNEATPLQPVTPYGVSKVTQDLLALQYHLSHGLPTIRLRPFNHAGPRQAPDFVIASFAQQIARIELGAQPPVLKVGNLDARRDFTDVRDVVRAYLLAAEKGTPGEVYNIGSGTAPRLRDLVARLLTMTRTRIKLEVDPSRKHAVEADVYLCDSLRFRRLTGWQPQISLDRTLRDTLEYWRGCERRAA
ncbi:MAG TPA: GDP-mannose 4,6-dehydratase [Candidatus Dormibacteraeota bacterium]|nr:GDP-mannose 4,6-dehydratase [Candidatus Dormibacteraeota bacterium]